MTTIPSSFFDIVNSPPAVKSDWELVYNRMIVHTRGVYPKKLMESIRPNEPEDIKLYRKDNWEPITQDAINRGLDSVYRTLFESNGKIKPAELIVDYLADKRFNDTDQGGGEDSQTFKEYHYNDVLRADIDDPNGYLVWMPAVPDELKNEQPNLIPANIPANTQVETEPWIINSSRIVFNSQRLFVFTALTMWQFVEGGELKKAPYYWVLTPHQVVRYIPFATTTDNKPENANSGFLYKEDVYYTMRGADQDQRDKYVVPRILLGGHRTQNKDSDKYYQSYFSGFVAFGNETLRAWTDNQGVRVMCNFPIKEEKGQDCKSCEGRGRVVSDGSPSTCNECGGSGQIASSPYSVRVKEKPTNADEASIEWAKQKAVEYYYPDPAILEQSAKTWKEFLEMAEASVNILFIKLAQSGVAKEIDRDGLYAMLAKISANISSIQLKSLNIIQQYRVVNPSNWGTNIVVEPTDFKIKSSKDIIEEIDSLATAPSSFANNTAIELSRKLYNGNLPEIKITKTLTVYDPFYTKTTQDISQIKSAGQLTERDIPRHNYANQIMHEILIEVGEERFLEMEYIDIKTLADEKLDVIMVQVQASQASETQSLVRGITNSVLES